MNILLLQLDGKLPNIALMRISAHHKALGDTVTLRRTGQPEQLSLWDERFDRVYGSLIFERTRPVAQRLLEVRPDAVIGGTGWDISATLEQHGITTLEQDYSAYPRYSDSIGFTQRGCRLKCSFCVVPRKEGSIRQEKTVAEIYRGESYPRHIVLLDNDFFGQPEWQARIDEIRGGDFKVSFNQGINVRFITEESAAAIASVKYFDDNFRDRRIYTAWDNRKDEKRLFAGLNLLVKHGVSPRSIMVYMLIGFWPGETEEDWLYRAGQLRTFGALPYPMPYVRTPLTVGFQRWEVGSYARRGISWQDFKQANCQPRQLNRFTDGNLFPMEEIA